LKALKPKLSIIFEVIMKTVQISASLHEVFGKEATLAELTMIFISSTGTSLSLFWATRTEWETLPVWKTAVLFLLIFDIMAGFIANLTFSTNDFYRKAPKLRLVFIALHVQPLVFSVLMGGYFYLCLLVWIYTIIASLTVNALNKYPAQKALAGSLVAIGLIGLQVNAGGLPVLLLTSLGFYQLKVIYSFAVDQYAQREI
jgi:hypothetical protein